MFSFDIYLSVFASSMPNIDHLKEFFVDIFVYVALFVLCYRLMFLICGTQVYLYPIFRVLGCDNHTIVITYQTVLPL